MIIDPMVEVRDVGFLGSCGAGISDCRSRDPIRDALKAVAAHVPPVTMADRGITTTEYLARSGVPVSCEVRKFAGRPPPAPTGAPPGRPGYDLFRRMGGEQFQYR